MGMARFVYPVCILSGVGGGDIPRSPPLDFQKSIFLFIGTKPYSCWLCCAISQAERGSTIAFNTTSNFRTSLNPLVFFILSITSSLLKCGFAFVHAPLDSSCLESLYHIA